MGHVRVEEASKMSFVLKQVSKPSPRRPQASRDLCPPQVESLSSGMPLSLFKDLKTRLDCSPQGLVFHYVDNLFIN